MTIDPGASQPRHSHAQSEQIWIALAGGGELKVANGARRPFEQGQVARFADGDVHGFKNTGAVPFVYLSVTTPPIDFSYAYAARQTKVGTESAPASNVPVLSNAGGTS